MFETYAMQHYTSSELSYHICLSGYRAALFFDTNQTRKLSSRFVTWYSPLYLNLYYTNSEIVNYFRKYASLVPRPTSTAADGLHHRYVEVGSGESLGGHRRWNLNATIKLRACAISDFNCVTVTRSSSWIQTRSHPLQSSLGFHQYLLTSEQLLRVIVSGPPRASPGPRGKT